MREERRRGKEKGEKEKRRQDMTMTAMKLQLLLRKGGNPPSSATYETDIEWTYETMCACYCPPVLVFTLVSVQVDIYPCSASQLFLDWMWWIGARNSCHDAFAEGKKKKGWTISSAFSLPLWRPWGRWHPTHKSTKWVVAKSEVLLFTVIKQPFSSGAIGKKNQEDTLEVVLKRSEAEGFFSFSTLMLILLLFTFTQRLSKHVSPL